MQYHMIRTQKADGTNGLGGGLLKATGPFKGFLMYFDTNSLDGDCEKITSLGGKILQGKTSIENMGSLAVCQDPQGNTFALWEANKSDSK